MDSFLSPAHLALHFAAPVEGAGTPLVDDDLLGPVAPTAAHEVAPVHAYARVVALPPMGAQDAQLWILLAEGGRRLQIDQVPGTRWLVLGVVGLQLEVVAVLPAGTVAMPVHRVAGRVAHYGVADAADAVRVADHDSGRSVEAVLQTVADRSEVGQAHPAGLDGAGAGHPVAFALFAHFRGDVLWTEEVGFEVR